MRPQGRPGRKSSLNLSNRRLRAMRSWLLKQSTTQPADGLTDDHPADPCHRTNDRELDAGVFHLLEQTRPEFRRISACGGKVGTERHVPGAQMT
jgi:hypothetical protein